MSAVDTSTSAPGKPFGDPIDRVDGRLKVTGGARYAAEFPLAKLAHGFVVQSTIAAGQITQIDTTAAERSPGVVFVLHSSQCTAIEAAVTPSEPSLRRRRREQCGIEIRWR